MIAIKLYKVIFTLFIVLGAVLLIAGFFITQFQTEEPAKVTEHQADYTPEDAISIQGNGTLSGAISLQDIGKNKPKTPLEGDNTTGKVNALKVPLLTLYDGDKLSIPVSGEIKSKYYSGDKQIGAGVHQVTGQTVLTVTANELQAVTTFDNNFQIIVEIPDPPPKLNRIGLYWSDGWGGYYQRDFLLFKNTAAFGRVSLDKVVRVGAGVEFKF